MKKPIGVKILSGIHLLFALLFMINISYSIDRYNTLIDFTTITIVISFIVNVLIGILMIKGNIFGWGGSIFYFVIQLLLRIIDFKFDIKLIILSIIIYSIPLIYLMQENVLRYFGIQGKFKISELTTMIKHNREDIIFGLIILIQFFLGFYFLYQWLAMYRNYLTFSNTIFSSFLNIKSFYIGSIYYIVMIISCITLGIGLLLKKTWAWRLSVILCITILIVKIYNIIYVSKTFVLVDLIVKNLIIGLILVLLIAFLFKDSTMKKTKVIIKNKIKEVSKLAIISLIISTVYILSMFFN